MSDERIEQILDELDLRMAADELELGRKNGFAVVSRDLEFGNVSVSGPYRRFADAILAAHADDLEMAECQLEDGSPAYRQQVLPLHAARKL